MASQPIVEEKIVGNVWFHKMTFRKAGDFKMGHKHNFDHAHMVCRGAIEAFEMRYEGDEWQSAERISLGVFQEGDIFMVPKEVSHTIVALEDNTIGVCIQGVAEGEEEKMVSCFCNGEEWKTPTRIKL